MYFKVYYSKNIHVVIQEITEFEFEEGLLTQKNYTMLIESFKSWSGGNNRNISQTLEYS